MEWDVDAADTPVVSWHPEVVRDLCDSPDEIATLLWLTLAQAGMLRTDGPSLSNFVLGLMLIPIHYLSAQEVHEAVDRLAARGYLRRMDSNDLNAVSVDLNVVQIVKRRELEPRLLMQWNAAKASWPGPPVPHPEN
ncbi:hypothetical protein ACFYXS_37410 [Streptomyces sp. NPDC002574]|uniref:hypothetical protein n=1 Tax=Streptomyces sp. NPDC002574 TaxID=3364652 RepID=UPI0036755BD6